MSKKIWYTAHITTSWDTKSYSIGLSAETLEEIWEKAKQQVDQQIDSHSWVSIKIGKQYK